MTPGPHRHRLGMIRREFLQVGFSGLLGLSWSEALTRRALANPGAGAGSSTAIGSARGKAKSVILVFLTGGPSHHDTFDMKPNATEGIRGEFKPIATKAPGIQICEHLPLLAQHADKLAIVRSMAHKHANHLNATHWVLTGHAQPGAFFDKIASRDDYPHYASVLNRVQPRQDGTPSGVLLPTFLMEGPLTWPGQHAGFLGPKHDPWQIRDDPNRRRFKVDSLSLPDGYTVERLAQRRKLFDEVQRLRDEIGATATATAAATVKANDPYAAQRELACSMLASSKVAKAFQLDQESNEVRDRYGRHMFGQSLLLARRLVEAEVPIVQVNMGRVQNWDSHGDIFRRLKKDLLPPTDQGVSALLDDLSRTGMLDQTLVVITGEFGRTPKISKTGGATIPGRDHWPQVFSTVLAGAGVHGGQTIGQSDAIGGYPNSRPYSPADLAATIYHALGIDLDVEIRDRLNRPVRVIDGQPIAPLYL